MRFCPEEFRHYPGDEGVPKRSEVGEDLADVVTAAAQHGEDRVTRGSFQGATGETTIGFHVADFRLDCAAPSQQSLERWRQTSTLARDQYHGFLDAMPAIAAVDHGQSRMLIGERFDLFKRLGQGVPVIGVARHCTHADHEALSDGRRNADLGSEFVADPCLALGDAVHLRLVQSVDLTLGFRRLVQQLRDQNQHIKDPLPIGPLWEGVDLPAHVMLHASHVSFQCSQCFAHAL